MADRVREDPLREIARRGGFSVRDEALRQSVLERDAGGLPTCITGENAYVYKARLKDGRYRAMRLFVRVDPQRKPRHQAVAQHLQGRTLKCMTEHVFFDAGLRAPDGVWRPMMSMAWVPGVTLEEWVREKCRAKDGMALAAIAKQWVEVVEELAAAQVVHGDLSPQNVMVTPDNQLKLVDYDSLGVPTLFGKPTAESGTIPYQHPLRASDTPMSADLDRFSALFLYVVLRGLAAAPGLWAAHAEGDPPEAFLIRRSDLARPLESRVVDDLLRSPDREVVWLTGHLFRAAAGELKDVPSLTALHRMKDEASRLLNDPVKSAEANVRLRQIALESTRDHVRSLLEARRPSVSRPVSPVPVAVATGPTVVSPAPPSKPPKPSVTLRQPTEAESALVDSMAKATDDAIKDGGSSRDGELRGERTTDSIDLDQSVSLDYSGSAELSRLLDRDASMLTKDVSMSLSMSLSLDRDAAPPGYPSADSIDGAAFDSEEAPSKPVVPTEQILELKRGESRIVALVLALLVLIGVASLLLVLFVIR